MKKLKDLLKESKVWERKFGEKLPSLKDCAEQHAQNQTINEWQNNFPGFSAKEYDVIQNWIDMGSLSQTIAMYKKNKKSFTQFIKDAARG